MGGSKLFLIKINGTEGRIEMRQCVILKPKIDSTITCSQQRLIIIVQWIIQYLMFWSIIL